MSAKTFLQLAVRLRQECGVSGSGPSSTASQIGEYKKLVDWIVEADEEIQQERNDWRFMVGTFAIDTTAGTDSYLPSVFVTPVTNFRDVRKNTLNIYSVSRADESRLTFMEYQTWYDTYNTGSSQSGRPIYYTIGNDQSIKLGPNPDGVYHIRGEYQKSVTSMSVNADTPTYPSEFHMLPMYLAMTKYGRDYAAPEVFSEGNRLYKKMMSAMKRTQASVVTLSEAMA